MLLIHLGCKALLSARAFIANPEQLPFIETGARFAGRAGLTIGQKAAERLGSGPMAEWLRRGLQILARRFDSGSGLHPHLET